MSAAVTTKEDLEALPFLTQIAETVTRYGLPAFILTLPLEVTAVYLHLQLARIVLGVVALAYVYLLFVGRRTLSVPVAASAVVLVIFVLYSVSSWVLTRAPGSFNPFLDITAYPVTALLVVNLTRTESAHDEAWTALLVSSLAMCALGAFLYYTGLSIWRADPALLGRVNATFGDPNIMARFLTLTVCVAIFMFAARRLRGWLVISATVAGAAILPLTFSKSGYAIFPLCVVAAALLSVDRRRGIAIAFLALVVFSAAIVVNPSTRSRSLIVLQSISGTTNGVTASSAGNSQARGGVQLDSVRTYLITAGWQMFRDHPITGVGFGGYQHAIETRYSRFLPPNPPATLSHTSAITILAEQGVVGVLLLLAFLLLLARDTVPSLWRHTRFRDLIVIPAFLIIPIIAYSQFEGRFLEEPYLWLALGMIYSARLLGGLDRTIELPR